MNPANAPLNLTGLRVALFGGGAAALEAAARLLELGARLRVFGRLEPAMEALASERGAERAGPVAAVVDLAGCALVVVATGSARQDQEAAALAARAGLLVQVPDRPGLSSVRLLPELESPVDAPDPEGGAVHLVGAGPGDPELLTLKARRALSRADVVLYDRLVAPEVLAHLPPRAECIFVGKSAGRHPVPQERINAILIEQVRRGRRVVRLKGGDPFVFGRGGEEVDALRAAGIPYRVIPGVTAALGCSAYAGIPLTHRDYAQACTFVTGHRRDGTLDLPWRTLVQPRQTVVVYMGLSGLGQLCAQLVTHGLPAWWPAAVVEKGTQVDQQVVAGTLATLPAQAEASGVRPPSLVIVGEVVRLRETHDTAPNSTAEWPWAVGEMT